MLRSSTSGKGAPASSEARAPLPPEARSPSGRAAPLRGFGWSVRSVASFAARHRSECAGFPFGMRVREGPVSGPAGRGRTFPIPPRLPAARRTPMREPGPVPPPGCLPDVPGRPDPALPPDGLPDTADPSRQLIPPGSPLEVPGRTRSRFAGISSTRRLRPDAPDREGLAAWRADPCVKGANECFT